MTSRSLSAPRQALARRGTAAALCLALGAAIAQPGTDLELRFEQAQEAYARNHWAEAYQAYGQLAEQGHADAARIALQMWRHGTRLFGIDLQADERQLQRWVQVARCDKPAAACRALPPVASASRTARARP